MRALGAALALLLCVAAALPALAQADPPAGKVLPIEGKVLDIVGVMLGLDATLKDLGAKVTEQEIRIALSGDVLFDFDQATLRPDALTSLEKLAEVVKGYPKSAITVEGHTDAKGGDAHNQPLSERRARTVKDWLMKNAGVAPARIASKGWGKNRPAVPNTKPDGSDDPEGRQKNRRVEIVIKKS